MHFPEFIKPAAIIRLLTFAIAGFAMAGYILPFISDDVQKALNPHMLKMLLVFSIFAGVCFQILVFRKKFSWLVLAIHIFVCMMMVRINIYTPTVALVSIIWIVLSRFNIIKPNTAISLLCLNTLSLGLLSNEFQFAKLWPVIMVYAVLYFVLDPCVNNKIEKFKLWSYVAMLAALVAGMVLLQRTTNFSFIWNSLPFMCIFLLVNIMNLYKYLNNSDEGNNQRFIYQLPSFLILLNAAIIAGFAGIWYGFFILLLMPFTFVLFKTFEEDNSFSVTQKDLTL
ncbi:MAG: hypothetical protein IPO27_08515 [Bacteroidetes bacterium]|nr:hypothetical protein [Bacteroidota bacterium]